MFKPFFENTDKLIKLIERVGALHGRLEGMQIPRSLLLNLERDNLIQSSYSSNSIEGNPMTLPQVTNLILNEREPANKDEAEVRNYFNVLQTLPDYIEGRIDQKMMETLHAKLMQRVRDDIAGSFRNKEVFVGRKTEDGGYDVVHNPPHHTIEGIKTEIENLSKWLENSTNLPLIQAGVFHHRYVYIHPFEDGNGRTCRLLTTLILMKGGYKINKYFVLDDYYNLDRERYSEMLNRADKGNLTEWLEYFIEGVVISLESASEKVETGVQKVEHPLRPTRRERDALEVIKRERSISSTELAEILGVTRTMAGRLLKGLVEKGLIEKFGKTKGTYYKLIGITPSASQN